jgi:hypothetical protein
MRMPGLVNSEWNAVNGFWRRKILARNMMRYRVNMVKSGYYRRNTYNYNYDEEDASIHLHIILKILASNAKVRNTGP